MLKNTRDSIDKYTFYKMAFSFISKPYEQYKDTLQDNDTLHQCCPSFTPFGNTEIRTCPFIFNSIAHLEEAFLDRVEKFAKNENEDIIKIDPDPISPAKIIDKINEVIGDKKIYITVDTQKQIYKGLREKKKSRD